LERGTGDNWNFADGDAPDPVDEEGHGTFIAGVLVGNGIGGICGVCPGCRILPLKILLSGDYAARRDAILYAVSRVSPGQRLVLNLSWKISGDVALIRDAIMTAAAAGAIVVTSAGNDIRGAHANLPHFPSDYPAAISVAAVGPDGKRPGYSYFGDEVDIAAPGGVTPDSAAVGILSAVRGGSAGTDCGTSFAAPHVAGAAALLFSRNPTWPATQVRFALESSARPLAEPGLGRGLVDVGAALNALPAGPPFDEHSGASTGGRAETLAFLNTADPGELASRYGLLPFTARLLVARRPFGTIDDIRGTLGLTDEQFARLAG
jgi:subtilisin family serine protease